MEKITGEVKGFEPEKNKNEKNNNKTQKNNSKPELKKENSDVKEEIQDAQEENQEDEDGSDENEEQSAKDNSMENNAKKSQNGKRRNGPTNKSKVKKETTSGQNLPGKPKVPGSPESVGSTNKPKIPGKPEAAPIGNPKMPGFSSGTSSAGGGLKSGAKRLGRNLAKAIKNAAKAAAKAIGKAVVAGGPIVWIVVIGIVVVLIIIALLINDDSLDEDEKISESSRKAANDSFLATADKDQLDKANNLYDTYLSYLGYTTDQINYIYDQSVDSTNHTDSRTSIDNYYKTEFGSASRDSSGVVSVEDKEPLYKHILNTEKYNFNKIKWKKYGHDINGSQEISDGELYKDKELGIKYPSDGSMTAQKFMDMASPYLLSSSIVNSFALAQITDGTNNNDIFDSSLPSPQELYDQMAKYNSDLDPNYVVESSTNDKNLAYQIIKNGMSDITISQYNLSHLTENTHYYVYKESSEVRDFFDVRVTFNPSKLNFGTINYTYNFTQGESNVDSAEEKNTRLNDEGNVDPMKETLDNSDGSYNETVYYVTSAKCFDVVKNFSYIYTKYSGNDTRTNANSEDESTENYLEYADSVDTSKLGSQTSENRLSADDPTKGSTTYLQLIKTFGEDNVVKISEETENEDGSYSITYRVISKPYYVLKGTKHNVTRKWDDTVTPSSTSTSAFKLSNLYDFYDDANNLQAISRNVYNEETNKVEYSPVKKEDIENSEDKSYFENLAKDSKLNVIDILDSCPPIYSKYIDESQSVSDYIGIGKEEIFSEQGYDNVKEAFKKIAKDNKLPFAYGISLGYTVNMNSSSDSSNLGSGKKILYEYIYQLEGTGTMKEENGIKYYQIYTIGKGKNRTVGHGLDLETSGRESDLIELANRAGYSISTEEGAWIPADIVDEILDQEIEKWYATVTSETADLNLKEYQIFALTSRALNCGYNYHLAYDSSPSNNNIDFLTAYNTYWNGDTDDKYDALVEKYGSSEINSEQEAEILSNVDYSNKLFSEYLAGPNNGGELDNRRKSEWILFTTGYYGFNTNIKKFYSESGGTIVECAEYIHKYMEDNNYTYCVKGTNRYEECGEFGKYPHGLNDTFEESKTGFHNSCCATFVSWVLQDAGYVTKEEHIQYGLNGANNLSRFLENKKGWTRVNSDQMEAGDIMVYDGHVQIYAGDGTTYNAGSGPNIRRDSPYSHFSTPDYALRAPN